MKRRPKGRKPQNIIHHLFCQHRLITTHKEETIHREIIFTRRRTVQHWYTTSWTYIRRNQQIQGNKYQKSYKTNSLWDPWCMIRICFRSPSISSKIISILSTFQIIKYQLQMIKVRRNLKTSVDLEFNLWDMPISIKNKRFKS